MNNPAWEYMRNNKLLIEAARFRHLRYLIIGFLQVAGGFSYNDAMLACDLEMGYNAHYGWLHA